MEVYRLCNEVEYQIIGNTMSFDNIGSIYKNNSKENNHNYHNNQKYIHFFKEYTSLFYLYLKPGLYMCTYDIPDELLEKYVGVGQYLDIVFMRKLENVVEYAIPNNEILFEVIKNNNELKVNIINNKGFKII